MRRGLVTTGVAAIAVAGVIAGTAALTGKGGPAVADPQTVAVGAQAAPVATRPPATKKVPKASKFVFQNTRTEVGTLAPGREVSLGDHLFFATKGTQWAVISRVPGEPAYEPFGWRRTVGNANLGDGTSPGIQSSGAVHSSVFKNDRVSTVVYTRGQKAWYAKVYRLAGIPGWVESSARLTSDDVKPGTQASVFVYDANGRLLVRFGDAKGDPLAK
ncbi:hypothetical protein GCM10009741_44620 [Kribbella lupini]|uniref:Uncharacterized protein n=1 Tax=Kribbella lupini TaxID=291602 RepID=A0ABP4M4L4_9ACTN